MKPKNSKSSQKKKGRKNQSTYSYEISFRKLPYTFDAKENGEYYFHYETEINVKKTCKRKEKKQSYYDQKYCKSSHLPILPII